MMADPTITKEENLRAEYGEVCSNIRWLADVRFKLLGLIPLATILGAWFATSGDMALVPLISLFGLVITVAIMIYNERNDQHYNELIGRAKGLERELGLYEGQFSQRSSTWLMLLGVKVNHSTGVYLIYQASITAWVFGILYPVLDWLLWIFAIDQSPLGPPNTAAIALVAAVIAIVGVRLLYRYLVRQKEVREEQMRDAAKLAMKIIVEDIPLQNGPGENEQWKVVFEQLAQVKKKKIERVEEVEKTEEEQKEEERKRQEAKEKYYKQKYADLAQPSLPKPSILKWNIKTASLLAASLTDIPARWFETMYREGFIDRESGIDLGETIASQDPPEPE